MSNAPDSGIIIGVGHVERQDDGVGPSVARALAERGLPAVVHQGEGSALLDLWAARPACVVIDALAAATAPGCLRVFTDLDDPAFARAGFVHSTHRLGLPEAVALGRALGPMPDRLVVIGVTGGAFGFGRTLSPPVAAAAERLIEALAGAEDPFGQEPLDALSRRDLGLHSPSKDGFRRALGASAATCQGILPESQSGRSTAGGGSRRRRGKS